MRSSLPFPQNRHLALRRSSNPNTCSSHPVVKGAACVCCCLLSILSILSGSPVAPPVGTSNASPAPGCVTVLVPVIGHPLSSGRYYVVQAFGEHMGKVSVCSKEEDKTACCFGSAYVMDLPPSVFERHNVYQQVEVQRLRDGDKGFTAVAVATDGIPPEYLRKKKMGWEVSAIASQKYDLTDDAQGLDCALRSRTPDLDTLNVVVGRWYVPFMFVKADAMFVNPDSCCAKSDGKLSLKDQLHNCMFYKMTMEQSWEQIYSRQAEGAHHLAEVAVTATVRRSRVLLDGTTSVVPQLDGEAVWFRPAAAAAETPALGLDMVVWERMKWELERLGGWVAPDKGDEERVERVERPSGHGQWQKFACYVLVERFLLRRMDGSLALTCEFRHTDKIKSKWL